MTPILFHVNVPDPLPYACRLLRKAYRAGARVLVRCPAQDLLELDKVLWAFKPTEFVPHVVVKAGSPNVRQREASPIWLADSLDELPSSPVVLLNLSPEPVQGVERFERVIEIVSTEPTQLKAARSRWKHYCAMGLAPEKHEVGPQGAESGSLL
jgi:DNA polymerase-3 subunit chi